jgi:hypothetical protein
MKLRKPQRLTIVTALAVAALAVGAVSSAAAAPTVQIVDGKTSVELSQDLVEALGALGVTPGAIRPGKLSLRKGKALFPIPGGRIDLETLKGDIFHNGGLTLTGGDTTVGLSQFIIDTTDEPVLTGLVEVNGSIVGRLPLFKLDLSTATVKAKGRYIFIGGVGVGLTMEAADALNGAFSVSAFVEDFPIGMARVFAIAYYRYYSHYQ